MDEKIHLLLIDLPCRLPRTFWAAAFLLWAAALSALSVSQGPSVPESSLLTFLWNLAHAPMYGVLAPFALYAMPRENERLEATLRRALAAFVLLLIIGGGNEWLQGRTGYRSASWFDLASDAAGGGFLLSLILLLHRGGASRSPLLARLVLGAGLCAAPAFLATFAS